MVKADERSTVVLFRKLHNSARVFKNKVATEAYKIENDKGKDI